MIKESGARWLPEIQKTETGEIRKVGVEFELAGVSLDALADSIERVFGGKRRQLSPLEISIDNTEFGAFKLELDASQLQELAEKQAKMDPSGTSVMSSTVELIMKAAEQLVPWEIVTPPIPVTKLEELEVLVTDLREKGALGTRNALHYAFGLHLNPELPDLSAETILNYLRAYLCLYDWIVSQEKIDSTRRLTNYIKHFDKTYIELVTAPDYCPTQDALIDDYLIHNPTRNRSLDLLPLFAHIDEPRVRKIVDDPRVKSRPTFHYRLPNCDIDNSNWSVALPWGLWLEVERLANDTESLIKMCGEYRRELVRITHSFENRWALRSRELLSTFYNERFPS